MRGAVPGGETLYCQMLTLKEPSLRNTGLTVVPECGPQIPRGEHMAGNGAHKFGSFERRGVNENPQPNNVGIPSCCTFEILTTRC